MSQTLYYNFNLFNGKDNEIKTNAWMLVNDDGKIERLGRNQPKKLAAKMIDLQNKYVDQIVHILLQMVIKLADMMENYYKN